MPKIWFVVSDYFTYHRRLNIHMYYASKLRRLEIQLHDLTQINLESWFAFRLLCFFIFFSLWRLLKSLLCSPYLYSSNILSKRVLKADSCMFSRSLSCLLSFRLLSNKLKIIWLRLSTIDLLSPKLLPDFIHEFEYRSHDNWDYCSLCLFTFVLRVLCETAEYFFPLIQL